MTRLNIALILIASLAGAAGGALATALLMPAPLNPSVAAATNDPRIAEVAKAQLELQKAVAELRAAQAMLAPNSERTPISAGASATTSGETPASSTGVAALGNVVNAPDLTVESALAKLADPDLS